MPRFVARFEIVRRTGKTLLAVNDAGGVVGDTATGGVDLGSGKSGSGVLQVGDSQG